MVFSFYPQPHYKSLALERGKLGITIAGRHIIILKLFLAMENSPMFKLPPGFRFHPTDEELVLQYLRRKAFSCPLPASIIPEIDLARFNPWDLPGGCEGERYFFALREAKISNSKRSNRPAGSGYWKATGKDRTVVVPKCKLVVGTKKTLVFHKGKAPTGSRTDWIMHEYRLAFPQRHNSTNGAIASTSYWVLCRIFMKKRANTTNFDMQQQEEEHRDNGFIDFMGQQSNPSSPSPSNSSCVTEASEDSIADDISSFP